MRSALSLLSSLTFINLSLYVLTRIDETTTTRAMIRRTTSAITLMNIKVGLFWISDNSSCILTPYPFMIS